MECKLTKWLRYLLL